MLDLFSGSGIVARLFKAHAEHLIVNDLESFSHVANRCHLSNARDVPMADLDRALTEFHQGPALSWKPGFITELYAPRDDAEIRPDDRVFYTRRNALYLDTARQWIADLPIAWQPFFLGPLLAAASVHVNTAGVFKGFYKNRSGIGQFGGHRGHALSRIRGTIELTLPVLSRHTCDIEVHQTDANVLVRSLPPVDLAYLDPPYNQHPYGSNYFMLNLLVNYRRPAHISPVSGIPADWQRSPYNRRSAAADALDDLLRHVQARFVLLSYNSEGFLTPEQLPQLLSRHGTVLETLAVPHPTFRGSRNLAQRPLKVTEFLYLLRKHSPPA
jgi:adenine-specific DNA-methyltransferase